MAAHVTPRLHLDPQRACSAATPVQRTRETDLYFPPVVSSIFPPPPHVSQAIGDKAEHIASCVLAWLPAMKPLSAWPSKEPTRLAPSTYWVGHGSWRRSPRKGDSWEALYFLLCGLFLMSAALGPFIYYSTTAHIPCADLLIV